MKTANWRLLCFVLMLAFPYPTQAAKRALLVGLNRYQHLGDSLDGCENDVRDMRELLISRFDYPPENIKVLLNEDATKQNIIDAIETWLIEPSQPGDALVFYYSGHGSRIRDLNGDEPDGRDETLCPYDINLINLTDYNTHDLVDDELGALLSQCATDNLTVIFDSCHSGTATKGLMDMGRPKELPGRPPLPPVRAKGIAGATESADDAPHGKGATDKDIIDDVPGVLISGCGPDQTSMDASFMQDGKRIYNGALTFNLLKAVQDFGGQITYEELMRDVRSRMRARFTQTPQLEGHFKDRDFLGGSVPAPSYVTIKRVDGNQVVLEKRVGTVDTLNSTYAIFGNQETAFTGVPLAEAIVTGGSTDATVARLIGAAPDVAPGCRAVLKTAVLPQAQLFVRLLDYSEPERTVLAPELEKALPYAKVVGPTDYVDCALRRTGSLQADVLTADGFKIRTVTAPDLTSLLQAVDYDFGRLYCVKHLATLENPAPPFRVTLTTADGRDTVPLGQAIRFRFHSERDCYLTLIDVGTSGKITVLFPNKWNPDGHVSAGQDIEVPPAGARYGLQTLPPAGRELVKAIATTEPIKLVTFDPNAKQPFQGIADTLGFLNGIGNRLGLGLGGSATQVPVNNWSSATLILDITKGE